MKFLIKEWDSFLDAEKERERERGETSERNTAESTTLTWLRKIDIDPRLASLESEKYSFAFTFGAILLATDCNGKIVPRSRN